MSQKLVDRLRQEFGDAILAAGSYRGDETVTVASDRLLDVLAHLRDAEGCEQLLGHRRASTTRSGPSASRSTTCCARCRATTACG